MARTITGYLAECVRKVAGANSPAPMASDPGMDGSAYKLVAPGGCGGILYGGLTGLGGGTGL